MSFLTESANYEEGVYQLEITDRVIGGPNGISNLQAKQLANRTAWLKQAIDTLESGGGPFEYNASAGTLPIGGTNGTGVAGIKRKDTYYVTVAGTVSGVSLQIGDQLTAKVDEADDISEFVIVQANSELATATVIGMVKLAQDLSAGSQSDAVLSVAGLIALFAKIASPTFTGTPAAPNPSNNSNSTQVATTAWVVARILEEATARGNAVDSEATARNNADVNLQNNINSTNSNLTSEATTRANADAAMVPYLVPSGAMMDWPALSAPSGWLICDGSAVSRVTYSILFGLIGTTFGVGDGSTTFNLPNMQGKFSVGYQGTDFDYNFIGKQGGEKKHQLTEAEHAIHNHSYKDSYFNGELGPGQPSLGGIELTPGAIGANGPSLYNAARYLYYRTGTTATEGGNQPHENRPPYVTLNKIIKI